MNIIPLIIVVLILALGGLLLDWPAILKKKQLKKIPFKKPAIPSFKREKFVPTLKQDFSFDEPDSSEPSLDQIVVEEESNSSYTPSREVEDLLAEADVCFRKGEMKAAEDYYLKAAAKDPRCSKAYSRLGVIYLEHGDNWDEAEDAFRHALKTDPENGFILNNLGLVLYHRDRYADAIRHFEQAVRHDEFNAARHANLGMGYMAMRQYAKAESSFKKALKLAPNEMEYKDLLNESIEKKNAHKTMIRR